MNVKISGTSEQDVFEENFLNNVRILYVRIGIKEVVFFSKRHLLKVHTRLQKHLHDDKYKGMT